MNDSVSDAYVFAHDPLCPWMQPCPGSYEGKPHELIPLDSPDLDEVCYNCTSTECRCNLIAKVRDEERSKDLDYQYIAAQAEADGYRNALNDIVKQIESMLPITLRSLIHNKTRDAVYVDEVIAMIRGKLE